MGPPLLVAAMAVDQGAPFEIRWAVTSGPWSSRLQVDQLRGSRASDTLSAGPLGRTCWRVIFCLRLAAKLLCSFWRMQLSGFTLSGPLQPQILEGVPLEASGTPRFLRGMCLSLHACSLDQEHSINVGLEKNRMMALLHVCMNAAVHVHMHA